MAAVINPFITDAGLAAAIAQAGNGLKLAITHVALGSGLYTPTASQTAMAQRREKVAIAGGSVSGIGAFRLSVLFPSWTGAAYSASEIGFYAGDPDAGGVLFAVYSAPAGLIVSRTNIDYVASFAMQLARVPPGSVTIMVDIALSQAMAQLAAHVGEADPHTQYEKKTDLQLQAHTSFLTSGALPNYIGAVSPVPTLVAGLRVRAKIHNAYPFGRNPTTLNLNGLGVRSLKQYDGAGAKINATLVAGQYTDLQYDGADWLVLDSLYPSGLVFTSESGISIRANVTLGLELAGGWAEIATPGLTITLPPLAVATIGRTTFTLKAMFAFTLKASGSEVISSGAGAQPAYAVMAGQTLTVVSDDVAGWFVLIDGFGARSFENSLGFSGYQRMPGGLIMQWGDLGVGNAVADNIGYLPIAFPTAGLHLSLQTAYTPLTGQTTYNSGWFTGKSQFTWRPSQSGQGTYFFAIGC